MTVRRPQRQFVGVRVALLALLISMLWGANIVALKLSLEAFSPLWNAFLRMLVAAPVIALWARVERIRLWPGSHEWGPLLLLGVLCSIQISLLNVGTDFTSAAYAVVLLNSHPIFTNLLSHYFTPGDRLSWTRVIGLAAAMAGICAVFLGKPEARLAPYPLLGNLIATTSAFFVGVRAVTTKRVVQGIDATRAIFWTIVISLPFFLTGALAFEPALTSDWTWIPVMGLLYQAVVVAGFCFILWTRLLRDYPPGVLSVFAFPTPIFGLVFSAIVFSEKLAPALIVGVAAVVAGILIVARPPRNGAKHVSPGKQGPLGRAA